MSAPWTTPAARVPALIGERVTLRAVRVDDVGDVVDISVYDGVPADDHASALAMLRRIEADAARGETAHWGICLTGSDTVIGTIGFYRGFEGGVGEVGYVLRTPFRGRGVMREALALVVAYGFEQLGLSAIQAHTDASNAPSVRLLERLGFEPLHAADARLTFELRPGMQPQPTPTDAA